MQSCGDQIFIGFEKVCTIAHGRQDLPLFEKLSSRLDQSTTTGKAKNSANSRIHRYTDPALRFFSDKVAEFIDLNKGAGLRPGLVDW